MNPKVLIAGGCGFIGHRVVEQFLRAGFDPYVIDICTDYGKSDPAQHWEKMAARRLKMSGAPIKSIDICDSALVAQYLTNLQPSLVIHLASPPIAKIALEQPLWFGQQIVLGTLSLLEATVSAGATRFIYISSSMVYGNFESEIIDELHPQKPTEPYGSLKLAAEHLVRNYTTHRGLAHTIVRPCAVYGPTGHSSFVITRFVNAAKNGEIMTVRGRATRLDFTFVDDVARGIFLAATSPQAVNETFNISFGRSRTLLEAATLLSRLASGSTFKIVAPDPLYPRRGTLSNAKAESLLGFVPQVPLEQGLQEFYDSF